MLLQFPQQPNLQSDRLTLVLGELTRTFRQRGSRVAVDAEAKRHAHHAMCTLCDWQREFDGGPKACDEAMKHGQQKHGNLFAGFVRIETR
jgi:hypothetical protein